MFQQLLIHATPDILRGNCEPQYPTTNICIEGGSNDHDDESDKEDYIMDDLRGIRVLAE